MNYAEEMVSSGKEKEQKSVNEEHQKIIYNKVWKSVPKEENSKIVTVMTGIWEWKNQPNMKSRARVNAKVYKQVDGEHYASS